MTLSSQKLKKVFVVSDEVKFLQNWFKASAFKQSQTILEFYQIVIQSDRASIGTSAFGAESALASVCQIYICKPKSRLSLTDTHLGIKSAPAP